MPMTHWFPRLLLITFVFQTSIYAIRPMVSYRAIDLGAGVLMIGVVASSYAALSLLAAVTVGRWVDRWGEARFIGGGVVLIASTSLGLIWIESLWVLAASQALMGLGHIMTLVGTQALIANATTGEHRDARFGVFMVVASLGQLAGPAAAGMVAGLGASSSPGSGAGLVFACAGALLLVALVAAASLQWRPGGSGADRGKTDDTPVPRTLPAVRQVLAVPGMPPAMLASLTVLTSVDILAAYLPVYGESRGMSVEVVGFLLAGRAAASMLSRLLMLPLLRALGRRWLLIASMALPAAALIVLPLGRSSPVLFALMAVIGFGLGLGQPLTLTWVTQRARPEARGTAIGVRLTGNRLGQLVLPAAVGVVAGATSVVAIFPTLGLLLLTSVGFVLPAPLDERDAPGESTGPAVPL
jgi:MFS family permease